MTAILLAAAVATVPAAPDMLPADSLYGMARAAEADTMYLSADTLYQRAYEAFADEGDRNMADSCRTAAYRMQRIALEHPFTRGEADSLLRESCPWLSQGERDRYFESGQMDRLYFQCEYRYFGECVQNLLYRNLDLMHEYARRNDIGAPFVDGLSDIIHRPAGSGFPLRAWQPLIRPVEFLVEGSLTLSAEELPERGTLRIWLPVPLQSTAQADPRVLSVSPQRYVRYPATVHEDLGTLYMEVPLDSLEGDLEVSVKTVHTHYQRSCRVDPELVGEYDTAAPEYLRYTAQGTNIVYTQEMRRLAQEVVGDEDNPYLQARMIYDYVVENIPYSNMPHMTLLALGIPESVFCHEHGYGDCGTQSMYFSALCRSLGIPARACGGRQLVPGIQGAHFWAEFMVPGYGWVPADVTVAETADWSPFLSGEEAHAFKDYFFGNLDPYRMVIQKDVNLPLSPDPGEQVAMETAIQFPAVVCSESPRDLSLSAAMGWEVRVTPMGR